MTEQQRAEIWGKADEPLGKSWKKCNKGTEMEMERAARGVTREWEEISYTNKSYLNKNQLSWKQAMDRNKETIAGEDNMTWDLWYQHFSKVPWWS